MSLDRARHFADQAAASLQAGQAGLGLELAEQALQLDPLLGDAENLRGVAFSMGGQPRPAEEAWLRAAELMPGSGKPFYNLAVHYYTQGKKQDALNWAARALVREPNHAPSYALQKMLESQFSYMKPDMDLPYAFDGVAAAVRADPKAGGGIAGWVISAVSLMSLWMGYRETVGSSESISAFVALTFVVSYMGGLAFLFIDATRSKRSYAWCAAYAFVGCVLGWVVLPAYLIAGLQLSNAQVPTKERRPQ